MSKHTPGPWHLSNRMCPQDGEGFYWVSADSTLNLKVEPCADGYRIGENEANARLIAAAPELLAALERYLDDDCPFVGDANSCECGPNGDGTDECGRICCHRQAWAAIAKAKGGAS